MIRRICSGTLSEMREFLFCAEMGVCPHFVHARVHKGVNEWTKRTCRWLIVSAFWVVAQLHG